MPSDHARPRRGPSEAVATAARADREPRGKRHAVDTDTGLAACGTLDVLQVFDDQPWLPEGDWCETCEALVPFD